MIEIANETAFPLGREGQRVSPEIPLEGDDGEGAHADKDHAQGGLPSCQARVQKAQARDHDHHHGRCHDDERLIPGGEPLI